MTDLEKLEEIYLVLSDLRYLLHKDNNLEEYQDICAQNYKRVATCAEYARELLPVEVVARHDEE